MQGPSPDYPIERSAAYWAALLQPPTEPTPQQSKEFFKNMKEFFKNMNDMPITDAPLEAMLRERYDTLRRKEEKEILTQTWDNLFKDDV